MNQLKAATQALIAVHLLSVITPAFASSFLTHPDSDTTSPENLARAASGLGSVLSQDNVSGSVANQVTSMA